MKTMSRCLVFAFGIVLLAGCYCGSSAKIRAQARQIAQRKSAARNSPGTLIIIKDPATQVIHVTNMVEFSVITHPITNVQYQWFFNNVEILNSTNREHIITNVAFTDVGEYSVRATLGAANVFSAIAYLSVYQLWATNSNAGLLTSPAGLFVTAPAMTCSGLSFSRSYTPQDPGGFFYTHGPYVPMSAQYGPFKNTSYCANLRVTTAIPENAGLTVGHQLVKSGTPLWCEAAVGGRDRTQFNLNPSSTASQSRYQIVLYSGALPAFGSVSFFWEYNGSPLDE